MSSVHALRFGRRVGAVIGVIAVVSIVSGSVAAAPVPVTLPPVGDAAALLTDVSVAATPASERVGFSFADGVLPESQITFVEPPFLNIAGEEVSVAGTDFVQVRMFPASGVNVGGTCVDLPTATAGAGEVVVPVFWTCAADTPGAQPVAAAERVVADGDASAVLTATIEELLGGPDADEEAAGLSSLFSSATEGLLLGVTIEADGTAIVDFDPALATVLTNASASAASEQLLRELDATVMFADEVTAAEYQLGGSCDAFYAWLQRDCETRTQQDADSALFAETYLGPLRIAGAVGGTVTEVVQISDFEAVLVWVVGLSRPATVDATTTSDPAQLVLEITPAAAPAQPVPAEPTYTG